jgi:hypothetical protein
MLPYRESELLILDDSTNEPVVKFGFNSLTSHEDLDRVKVSKQ